MWILTIAVRVRVRVGVSLLMSEALVDHRLYFPSSGTDSWNCSMIFSVRGSWLWVWLGLELGMVSVNRVRVRMADGK